MEIGQTIKTVYGKRQIISINKSSVTVDLGDRTMRISLKQIAIMN